MLQEILSSSSVITGSSTHTECIECLSRDVHRSVIVIFEDTFRLLESEQLSDPLNEVDMYCLHTVFLPVITRARDNLFQPGITTQYQLNTTKFQSSYSLPALLKYRINQVRIPQTVRKWKMM